VPRVRLNTFGGVRASIPRTRARDSWEAHRSGLDPLAAPAVEAAGSADQVVTGLQVVQWLLITRRRFSLRTIPMRATLIEAMRNRCAVEFQYNGQLRIVNPHALYSDNTRQEPLLLGWQTEGESSSRVPPCWGNFKVNNIVDLVVLEESHFAAQPDFDPQRYRNLIYSI
jgi:hypothetical protein